VGKFLMAAMAELADVLFSSSVARGEDALQAAVLEPSRRHHEETLGDGGGELL
jgi:hypothetical protein